MEFAHTRDRDVTTVKLFKYKFMHKSLDSVDEYILAGSVYHTTIRQLCPKNINHNEK